MKLPVIKDEGREKKHKIVQDQKEKQSQDKSSVNVPRISMQSLLLNESNNS